MIERAAQDPERVQATQAMTVPELKTRLLKLAQAYKAGRVRNSEFEEQIKQAYKDVEAIPKLQRELDRVQLEHKQRSQQLLEMQEETQQEGIYHQTIKKQEIVIAKLENLLEKSVNQRFKNEKNGEELQALKSDIATLQLQVRKVSYGPNN